MAHRLKLLVYSAFLIEIGKCHNDSKKGIADLQSHGNKTPLKYLSFNIIYIMRSL